MSDEQQQFWNLDLSKLTCSGCLLMVLTVGVVLGVAAGLMGLLKMMGMPAQNPDGGSNKVVGVIALLPAVALGGGVFALGRKLLKKIGMPIMRDESRK